MCIFTLLFIIEMLKIHYFFKSKAQKLCINIKNIVRSSRKKHLKLTYVCDAYGKACDFCCQYAVDR